MLIDWFTIVAQVLNFIILVWLLKRFLYKPIIRAIDAREQRIAAELADADQKKAEAQKESDEFKRKNETFDRQRTALLSRAAEEANAERHRLLEEARQAADTLSAKRQETLRNDAHNLNQAVSRRTRQEVFAIARKALTDLAATSLEERLAEVFMRRLREMDGRTKAGLAEALKTASGPALVRSAFDLPVEQRAAIQKALNETFSTDPSTLLGTGPSTPLGAGPSTPLRTDPSTPLSTGPSTPLRTSIRVRFETAPDLISGIELTTNGQKVAWSIADYLASLEKGVDELLQDKGNSEAKAEPEPEKSGPEEPGPKARSPEHGT